jgi:hypothetical protein
MSPLILVMTISFVFLRVSQLSISSLYRRWHYLRYLESKFSVEKYFLHVSHHHGNDVSQRTYVIVRVIQQGDVRRRDEDPWMCDKAR